MEGRGGRNPGARGDAALVEAIAGGDREALGVLYDRHAPALLALGLRIIGHLEEAQDVLHDVFLEVWQRAAGYDAERGSVGAWLTVRMRSRALDRCRLARVRRTVGLEARPEQAAPATAPTDRAAVARALEALPVEQREAIEMAYFRGLTTAEIAACQGVPRGTVKSRLRGARLRLERALAPRPPQRGDPEEAPPS